MSRLRNAEVPSCIDSSAFASFLGTIMCYGQTGAGKTYTMTGATAEYKHRGIIPRALQQVLDRNGKEVGRNNKGVSGISYC